MFGVDTEKRWGFSHHHDGNVQGVVLERYVGM